jgi:hypothetical protein
MSVALGGAKEFRGPLGRVGMPGRGLEGVPLVGVTEAGL